MGGEMQPNPDCFWASVQPGSGQSGNGSNGWFKTGWAGNSPNEFFFYNNSSNAFFALFFVYWAFYLITAQNFFFLCFLGKNCQNWTFLLSFFLIFFIRHVFCPI
jgi:hypothetical protein